MSNLVSNEFRLLATAVMYYTRLPTPRWVGYSDEQMHRSTRYFPAIGWLLGVVGAGVLWLAHLVLPIPVAVILGLSAQVLVSGAFHEDGFADVCDGFGAGGDKQRILTIMKDSRIGVFAVVGLILLFTLKISAVTALAGADVVSALVVIVFAHVLSRWCVVTIIFRGTYARTDPTSKARAVAHPLSVGALIAATVWLLPFVGLAWWHPWWLVAIPVGFLVRVGLHLWFIKRIGGYTGDCLGATQQIIEVVTIMVCLALVGGHL